MFDIMIPVSMNNEHQNKILPKVTADILAHTIVSVMASLFQDAFNES